MKRTDKRQKLIEGTIYVIATEGLDKASTKQIGKTTSINEAYIYRYFKGKEDMFAKTFEYLDQELYAKVMQHMDVMYITGVPFIQRCRTYFFLLWQFLLEDRNEFLTYVRYFYSTYFVKYSLEGHQKRVAQIVERFRPAFIDEADVQMILEYILNVMLDFAVKVFNGQMPENDNYAEHVFRVVYAAIRQYFRNNEGSDFSV